MDVATYRAFVDEIKLSSLRERFTQAVENVVGAASEKAKDVAGRIAEPVTEGAKKQVGDVVSEGARALEAHSKPIGEAIGAGIAEHAPAVGRAMGEGIGEHLSTAGGKALTSAVETLKGYGKSPYVRGAGAALGTAYLGSKLYGAHKQRQRDERMERMVKAVEALTNKKDGEHV